MQECLKIPNVLKKRTERKRNKKRRNSVLVCPRSSVSSQTPETAMLFFAQLRSPTLVERQVQPRASFSVELIQTKLTVIRMVINSPSQRPVPATRSPARRPSPPAGGTYTAQGRRVPPSAAGSQLQIKLPAVGGGPRGQRTRARRGSPREARVSAASRPRALSRRPPALCRAPAAAAHSEQRDDEPGVADASQTQPATRSPARAELSSPPPA